MNDYLNIFLRDIFSIVDKLIEDLIIKNSIDKSLITLDFFSKSKQGDISTNLYMILKKYLSDKNYNLRDVLFKKINNLEYINQVDISNSGFINIFFHNTFIIEKLNNVILEDSNYGQNNSGKGLKINIEFVSANPTGPIHIAHVRGAVYGDVLSNIFEKNGYKVIREYYINDAGSQISLLSKSLYIRYQQLNGLKVNIKEDEYPGSYLINIAKEIFAKDKDKWLSVNKDERDKYFKKYAIDTILISIKNDLNNININFNKFTFETDIIKKSLINDIIKILKKKNLLYKGRLKKPKGENNINWKPKTQLLFKSTAFNDDVDRTIQKDNGEWTYFANDAAYHYDKILRNFDKLINVWGADHIGYIKRMKSIVEVMSNNKNFLDTQICQIVRILKNGKIQKMSKREGDFITLNNIYNKVGTDPLRYYMISKKNETPIDFDLNKVLEKNKDNPVFYCQYAYARASSVINKALKIDKFKKFKNQKINFDNDNISKYEREIILRILSWPYILVQSSKSKQPHKIVNFIEDLSTSFHSFWNKGKDNENLRFIDISNENKTISKLLWIESMRIIFRNAFQIIGIKALEKM